MTRPVAYRVRNFNHVMAILSQERERQDLTYQQLAARTNGRVTGQQIATWERGVYEPRARSLLLLAEALGYDLALIPREGSS